MRLFIKKFSLNKNRIKIAVNMKPRFSPWGGGNQFVEQFIAYIKKRGCIVTYRLEPDITHVLIVKSWAADTAEFDISDIRKFKKAHPFVVCIHRVNECDQRKGTDFVDEHLRQANEVADFTVFISDWLKDYFISRWFDPKRPHKTIHNGADNRIFYSNTGCGYVNGDIFRIVTHHWSDHWMKGFKVYQEVDRMISEGELAKFSLTVIGHWPKEIYWRSAKIYPPLYGRKLADLLRAHHVYLTASLWEPCGMHHIEGAQCGLPLVYHKDGGGIVEFGKRYGISFRDDVKKALLEARDNYSALRKRVIDSTPSGRVMCAEYEKVFASL